MALGHRDSFLLATSLASKKAVNVTITQGYNGEPLTGVETEVFEVTEDESGHWQASRNKVTVPGDHAIVYNPGNDPPNPRR